MSDIPSRAAVVVIGAGVVGTSVAYHLGRLGCSDVLLLERSKIGSGTTWHAAGNMETYRADRVLGEMVRYTTELFPVLERESEQLTGWRRTGRVQFTCDPERMAVYRSLPELGRRRGIEMVTLSPAEVVEKLPIASPQGLLGGAWIPSDGRANPTDLATAYARAARRRGVRIIEDTPVTRIVAENGRVRAVRTVDTEIACDAVVLAAGLWSRDLGLSVGLRLPQQAAQHSYILTKPIAGITADLPIFLGYDEHLYGREEVGGLLVGFFDANAIPLSPSELPQDFSFGLLAGNWDQIEPNMAVAIARFPVLETAEVKLLLNGPESFTPDGEILLGEAPGLRGCHIATAMNSNGIALAAGAGLATAERILCLPATFDTARLDPRRFADGQGGSAYLRGRVREVVTHMCKLPAPGVDFVGTRSIRRSPLHDRLAAAGAQFATTLQWERPLRFGGPGSDADELRAAETGVALVDRSSDCRFWLEGGGALPLLRRLSGAVADPAIGTAVLAPMHGGTGAIVTRPIVLRLEDAVWLVAAAPEESGWLRDLLRSPRPQGVAVVDVTAGWCCLALHGPQARDVLAAATVGYDPARDGVQPVEIGYAPALVVAEPASGALWAMVTTDYAVTAFDALVAHGEPFGLRLIGTLAAEALAGREALPASPG